MASSQPRPPVRRDDINALNARHGEEYATRTKAEVLDLLRRNGVDAAAFARGPSDEQLRRTGTYIEGLSAWTVEEWIANVLIGHTGGVLWIGG